MALALRVRMAKIGGLFAAIEKGKQGAGWYWGLVQGWVWGVELVGVCKEDKLSHPFLSSL